MFVIPLKHKMPGKRWNRLEAQLEEAQFFSTVILKKMPLMPRR